MREFFLASSALAEEPDPYKFDGIRTIDKAVENGFDGVQLFLDSRYHNEEYLVRVVERVRHTTLGVVIHLPNIVEDPDKVAAEKLAELLPDSLFLIHYEPTTETPDFNNIKVGWENSRIGIFDDEMREYIGNTVNKVENDDTFIVFDFARLMYLDNEISDKHETINFIREMLADLDPERDIIHLTDKTSWVLKFRDCACVVGSGICAKLLPDILAFDGIIVLEHEKLQQAIDSLAILRNDK